MELIVDNHVLLLSLSVMNTKIYQTYLGIIIQLPLLVETAIYSSNVVVQQISLFSPGYPTGFIQTFVFSIVFCTGECE